MNDLQPRHNLPGWENIRSYIMDHLFLATAFLALILFPCLATMFREDEGEI